MIIQAAGLALLAALSPTALLVAAVYLGSARPRLTATFYLVGAVAMSLVTGVILLVVLRSLHLNHTNEHTPRYGLRLGLGILLLLAAVLIARRKPKPPDPDKPASGIVNKLVANPVPWTAFVAGLLIFAPGVTFLAALQVIATSDASDLETAVAIIVVVVINVLLVWLPIVAHIIFPNRTTRYLTAFNSWLRTHGRIILTWVFVVVGLIMIGNGIYGLTVIK